MSKENETLDKAQNGNDFIADVVSSAVTAVRVRHWNEETDEREDGTVIDIALNTYLVIPDVNLSITKRWAKIDCDVLH